MVEMIALRTFAHGGTVVRRGDPIEATKSEAVAYAAGETPLARLVEAEAEPAPVPSEAPEPAAPKAPARQPRKRS